MALQFMLLFTAVSVYYTTIVTSEGSTKVSDKHATDKHMIAQYISTMSDNTSSESLEVRSFLTNKNRLWPSAIVPYKIDPLFNSWERKKIGRALKLFHKTTCIRFVPRTREKDYVRFTRSASSCSSSLGHIGGRQDILLDDDCFYLPGFRGAILHETMHSLGFIHEHQRTDRDCYVIFTGKAPDPKDYFYIRGTDTSFPYDIHSIMHYKQKSYLRGRHGEKVGNYMGTLTDLDKQKLNYVYCGKPHYCSIHPQECVATEHTTRQCRVYL